MLGKYEDWPHDVGTGKMSNSKKGSAAKSEPKEQSDAEDNNHEIAKPSRKMPDWSDSE